MSGKRREMALGAGLALLLAWLVGYPLAITLWSALHGPGGALGPLGEVLARQDEMLALARSVWIAAAAVRLAAPMRVPRAIL